MAWYPSAGSYQTYLQNQSYIENIGLEFKREAGNIANSISSQTKDLIANNNQIAASYNSRLDKISGILTSGFKDVAGAIMAFHADFNEKMELVIGRLDLINENLNRILEALINPRKTLLQEYYRDGCRLFFQGILHKAEKKFELALEIDDTDFSTHYQLGRLYLEGVDQETKENVVDLEKANYHLLQASTIYGRGLLRSSPSSSGIVAVAYLYASRSFYVQMKSNSDSALLAKAIELAMESVKIQPSFSFAHLFLARYYSLCDNISLMNHHLRNAIEIDRNYFFTVDNDETFNPHRETIKKLQEEFRHKTYAKAKPVMDKAKREFENLKSLNFNNSSYSREFTEIEKNYIEATRLYNLNNFFGYQDAFDFINKNLL